MTRFPRRLNAIAMEALIWLISILTVFLSTRHLFQMNSSAIFWGWDPLQMLAFIGDRYRFSDIMFGLGSDPVIGLGNIAYTVNPRWFPSYALTADSLGHIQDGPLAFAIGATELFAATVLCGRMNGFSLALSVAAGWLITLTVWQLFGVPYIVTILFFYPHHAELLSVVVLMASFALRLGNGLWVKNMALTAGIFLCLSFILFAEPTTLILALPVVGLFSASTLLLAPCWRSRYKIIACWASLALASLILGYIHYMAGLLNYTAASQFPDISKRVHTLYGGEVTLLLWTPVLSWSQILTPERAYVGGGLIGSIMILWLGSPLQRRLALGVLGAEAVFLTIGLSNYFLDYWFGPAVWYFETFLFPFFALGICFLLTSPILIARRFIHLSNWAPPELQYTISRFANATVPTLLALGAVVQAARAGETLKARSPENDVFAPLASPFPQPESSITQILKQEIKLIPGQRFRGRVAVFIGLIFPEEHEYQRYGNEHYFAQFATGNLHDGAGLWQDDIPTLMEYNTLISPPNFAFLRTFLTKPSDIIFRVAIGTRRIDQRILKAIGVRFIISDQPIADAALRAQITIPTPPVARERLGFAHKTMESFELYLYELADVNIGQFSPTQVRQSSDANQILTTISNHDLRLDQVVVASEPLPDKLEKAELLDFRVERDAFRIRAKSEGHSVLLLPWEFSQCLKITNRSGAARLFRADLFLTGVLFEGDLDATITFHTGPLIDSRCRLKDLDDSRQLKIRNAFDDRPALGNMR
jgi:hypothetical protein